MNFSPKTGEKNLSAVFRKFVSTRALLTPVDRFVDKFALNEESQRQLRSMPEDLQKDVMDSFSPKPQMKNKYVNTWFQSFAAVRATRAALFQKFPPESDMK